MSSRSLPLGLSSVGGTNAGMSKLLSGFEEALSVGVITEFPGL
jgi:hypothetical protein